MLDIGLSKNREALDRLLEAGAQVRYFDHHQPGDMPAHPNFESHIDTRAHVCTSLLVNQLRGSTLPGPSPPRLATTLPSPHARRPGR